MGLTRRRALITGLTSPDGLAMAAARALGQAGHDLILAAPSGQIEARRAELLAEGHATLSFQGDLTDPAEAARLAIEVGALEVLVAVADPAAGAAQDWHRAVDAELSAMVLVTRAVLPALRQSAGGRILLVGPAFGPVPQDPQAAHHRRVAGMIRDLILTLARENIGHDMTVNGIVPGLIVSPSYGQALGAGIGFSPLDGAARADELASLITYLAAPLAGFLTGQVIDLAATIDALHPNSIRKSPR